MRKDPEVIGEGSYGCVIKPSLPCSNKQISYKNKLSEVMISKNAIKELKEYIMISSVDKKKDFYLGVPLHCKLKKTKKVIKVLQKCKHLNAKYRKRGKTEKKLDLLVMNDGGENMKNVSKMMEQLFPTEENKKRVMKIWVEMYRLFRGIQVFQKHHILHHDIKPQNIVYDSEKNRANFIDFGHMRNIEMEKKKTRNSDNWEYESPFWNYPLEVQFLNKYQFQMFAHKKKEERKIYFKLLEDDLKNNRDTDFVIAFMTFFENISHNKSSTEKKQLYKKYKHAFYDFIMEQINFDDYETVLHKSMQTIDVYGLGMTLLYLLSRSSHFFTDSVTKKLESCFFYMTTPNLKERFTIDVAMREFESIMMEAGIHL